MAESGKSHFSPYVSHTAHSFFQGRICYFSSKILFLKENLSLAPPGERRFGHIRLMLHLHKIKAFSFASGRQDRFLQRHQLMNGTQARKTANPERGAPVQEGLRLGHSPYSLAESPGLAALGALLRKHREVQGKRECRENLHL